METVLEYAMKSGMGIFTILFIALLWWVLKANDAREVRYQSLVDKVTTDLGGRMTAVERDVEALPGRVADALRVELREVMKG
ncbi:MAG: BhlA/UviB family holin-like peptide [Bacillota bacterium]